MNLNNITNGGGGKYNIKLRTTKMRKVFRKIETIKLYKNESKRKINKGFRMMVTPDCGKQSDGRWENDMVRYKLFSRPYFGFGSQYMDACYII